MIRSLRVLVFSLAVLLSAHDPAAAQCTPDGLDGGPCCTIAGLKLPVFPVVVQNSLDICWLDCGVDSVSGCTVRWGKMKPWPNEPTSCGRFRARLRLSDAAGTRKWAGRANLTYSRTWSEVDPSGVDVQVWRFLVNARLRPTSAAGGSPCPVPACVPTFPNVRYTGYVDYVQPCGGGSFSIAWMLTHSCDLIDHAPGFPRGGAFHPGRAFTFVGPAAGFVIGPLQPVAAGATTLDAMRRVNLPMFGTIDTLCDFEQPLQAQLVPQQQFCICGSPNGPTQYVLSQLFAADVCGDFAQTTGGPFLPGYLSMGIGSWTDPTTYPGVEALRWSCGGYDYFEACLGTVRQEVFYGVTTIGGFPARQITASGPGLPLPPAFVDQANSLKTADNFTTTMNTPFASDHVLNLNF